MSKPAPAAAPAAAEQSFLYRNPGIVATVLTFVVAAGFIGALYRVATSHEAPAHSAPAGH